MFINFLGADHEVTGSCHHLQSNDNHILIDCGMEQGADLYVNQDIPVNPSKIDFVFVTHAHIDHSGLLPLLYSHGFRGKVYATTATSQLCEIMLKDSAHIQKFEAEWKNRKAKRAGKQEIEPLYDLDDVVGILSLFMPCDYNKIIQVNESISIRFVDAGHLLGSSSIEVWLTEKGENRKIVFSGDIGNTNKPLIKEPELIQSADYVVMESTYGDRNHPTTPDFAVLLAQELRTTFKRGGNVVIPAFSVGRTQEMLYYMRKIKADGLLKEFAQFNVYMDSPLAVEATNIFKENISDCFDEEALELIHAGINPIGFQGLNVATSMEESKAINMVKEPIVIISASGMCEAGRIRHHLKHNLWRKESTILFVGYQVQGTLGNMLLNGAKEVKLFGEPISVAANIVNLPGISGHADKAHLLQWAKAFNPQVKKYFIVHGDDQVCESFAQEVQKQTNIEAIAPYSGDSFDLITGERIKAGNRQLVKDSRARRHDAKTVSNVYARLKAAGVRLNHVIEESEGIPNKELARMADQIVALADKWDKYREH